MSIVDVVRRVGSSREDRRDRAGSQFDGPADVAGYVASGQGWGPSARFFKSRLHVVDRVLDDCAGGSLLDVGCGPGPLVAHLLQTRRGDFRITAADRSPAMVDAVAEQVAGVGDVRPTVGDVEDMPFDDEEFGVVAALGVLEYVDVDRALREIARVVDRDGLVVVTMLNPLSPYRVFQWFVHWPVVRAVGQIERLLGIPVGRRHAARRTGIHALSARRLRRCMRSAGLRPVELVYFDVTPLLPPFDKVIRRWTTRWRGDLDVTVGTGHSRWLGTGYLVTARPLRAKGR
ncbi:class I SAM-dependent methyltransferase [Kribbella sp. CA-245084]|uniref:class I SAM-dependent methyltransferase n=1 Tax=Kribbella sp. CA-245084 TaxID=3239940 RepID=UPI003D922CD7